ncbi:ig-like domain-containing protein [Trichonephila clavipes]|nr:ig-like domain-containing protein [Trichonephila clavipes]
MDKSTSKIYAVKILVEPLYIAPNVIPSRRRPRVSGSSSRYDVGDLVDINCTSAKESTPPILRWFINDREVSDNTHLIQRFSNCGASPVRERNDFARGTRSY